MSTKTIPLDDPQHFLFYQHQIEKSQKYRDTSIITLYFGLFEGVGSIAGIMKSDLMGKLFPLEFEIYENKKKILSSVSDLLGYMAIICSQTSVDFNIVAQRNIKKYGASENIPPDYEIIVKLSKHSVEIVDILENFFNGEKFFDKESVQKKKKIEEVMADMLEDLRLLCSSYEVELLDTTPELSTEKKFADALET